MSASKTLGIIGGMSPESTVSYYQFINREINARLGGNHSADIVMHSVDFEDIVRMQRAEPVHHAPQRGEQEHLVHRDQCRQHSQRHQGATRPGRRLPHKGPERPWRQGRIRSGIGRETMLAPRKEPG